MIAIAGTSNHSVSCAACDVPRFGGEFEHGSNRHEHDQRIETVPAHKQPETPHAVNALHALARRLLPRRTRRSSAGTMANQTFGGRG